MFMFKFILARQSTTIGFALIGNGWVGGNRSSTSLKYRYDNNSISAGSTLGYNRAYITSFGNSTVGVFATGDVTTAVEKYTFSTNAVAFANSLATQREGPASTSISTHGIIAGGYNGPGQGNLGTVVTTEKFTFSTNGRVMGGNLSVARDNFGAAGNLTFGVFGSGNSTDKYFYSTDTSSPGSALLSNKSHLAAVGNTTVGIFGGGRNFNTTEIYTYSSDSVTNGGALTDSRGSAQGAGNSTVGLFIAGYNTGSGERSAVDRYTYSTNLAVAGTSLSASRFGHAACSSTPGHL